MTSFMALFFFAVVLFVQSDVTTVMGKVTGIRRSSMVLHTRSTKHQEVSITKATKFEKNGQSASLKDLQVGDRVTVKGTEKDGVIDADTVRFRTEMRLDRRNPKYPVKNQQH